ncbi:glycine oxidase ThiO [Neobacillus sp. 179-C4.2 HS]|uniref:glycine oxidase n=1 Tax=Neobacillus driksii TaxID=3035913 RepID=A0ABV4YU00_9BACI|nr:glycine oxidase ThiO [Neobacillus sp. 179.-C4.2 HS]MDP5195145.1 glycine oxidase ThiO [Neobacillus sp. 179.-C4.2 HS]
MNKIENSFDVAVIGGGINGASIAYQLSKIGRKVIIIEKNQLGCEASSAAAGMLAAQAELEQDGPLFQMALKSQKMFSDFSCELFEYSGVDIEYVNKGMYKIAESEEIAVEVKKQVTFQRKWDPAIKWLDTKELREMEPSLSTSLAGGMYLPNDGHVQPAKLTQAFAKAAVHFGAEIRQHTEVLSFKFENSQVKGVITTNGIVNCDQVVVATGAWSAKLMRESGIDISVYPVKGECFSIRTERPIINTTIFSDKRCYLVPKRNGEIYIGATMIEDTYDHSVTPKGIARLIERATQLVPQIKDAAWERVWSGIRPQTGDGLPYIGEHPRWKGLFVATGHFRNGILLSPITGKLVADLVTGNVLDDALLSAFQLERHKETVQ